MVPEVDELRRSLIFLGSSEDIGGKFRVNKTIIFIMMLYIQGFSKKGGYEEDES